MFVIVFVALCIGGLAYLCVHFVRNWKQPKYELRVWASIHSDESCVHVDIKNLDGWHWLFTAVSDDAFAILRGINPVFEEIINRARQDQSIAHHEDLEVGELSGDYTRVIGVDSIDEYEALKGQPGFKFLQRV